MIKPGQTRLVLEFIHLASESLAVLSVIRVSGSNFINKAEFDKEKLAQFQ